MTADSLFEECWKDLPLIRRNLTGKHNVKEMFLDALRAWDSEILAHCASQDQVELYERALLTRVKSRGTDKYGFVVVTFILAAVAAAVISWLVKRWLDNTFPRAAFEAMRVGV